MLRRTLSLLVLVAAAMPGVGMTLHGAAREVSALDVESVRALVRVVLAGGAEIDMQDSGGDTALMVAARHGRTEMVLALLEVGAEMEHQSADGLTALMQAAGNGRLGIVRALVDAGAQVDRGSQDGKTALMMAAYHGGKEVVRALLEGGAAANLQSADGHTALMVAAMYRRAVALRVLLEAGAAVDVQDEHGHTALMLGSKEGHTATALALLKAGATVDLQDNDGWSALLVAAGNGHAEIVQALLDAEAGVELQNRLGETALQLATKFSHLEAQQVLVEAGADPTGITLIGLGDNYAKDTDTEEPCTDPVDPRDDPEAEDYVNVNNLPRHAKASIAVANEARLKYFLTQLGLGEHFLSFKKFGVKATADLKRLAVSEEEACEQLACAEGSWLDELLEEIGLASVKERVKLIGAIRTDLH